MCLHFVNIFIFIQLVVIGIYVSSVWDYFYTLIHYVYMY